MSRPIVSSNRLDFKVNGKPRNGAKMRLVMFGLAFKLKDPVTYSWIDA